MVSLGQEGSELFVVVVTWLMLCSMQVDGWIVTYDLFSPSPAFHRNVLNSRPSLKRQQINISTVCTVNIVTQLKVLALRF